MNLCYHVEGWREGMVREFGTNMYTLIHLKQVTNKVLLCSTGDSVQCYVVVWMGGEFGGEWYMYMCGWVPSLFTWNYHNSADHLYPNMGFPGGSATKNPPTNACQCRRCEFNPWIEKNLWRRKWQPTPVLLSRKFHVQRSSACYSPWDSKRVKHDLGRN